MAMRGVVGDLWTYHRAGYWVVIPTNGSVRKDGVAVMGRGLAWEAARRFPDLASHLGRVIQRSGSHVWTFVKYRLFTFPVKWRWMEQADLNLIATSAEELVDQVSAVMRQPSVYSLQLPVYIPRVGCGNGRLRWADVEPVLDLMLDERFVVVYPGALDGKTEGQ